MRQTIEGAKLRYRCSKAFRKNIEKDLDILLAQNEQWEKEDAFKKELESIINTKKK